MIKRQFYKAVFPALGLMAILITSVGTVRMHPPFSFAPQLPVPAGEFMMGSWEDDPDAQPIHRVYVDAFYIDKYEVTNAQYVHFLNAGGGPTGRCAGHICLDTQADTLDSHILYRHGRYVVEPGYQRHPVSGVSWYGARAYCQFHGKRLPTEAEWEKAARGVDGRAYPWGDELAPDKLNAGERVGDTRPVGKYPAGVSPYGAHDLAGNVWEWVVDWYDVYPGNTYTSPFFGEKYKVVRGGSWNHPDRDARSAHRDIAHPARRIHVVGFRCARDY